jgi:hypothetical protein
MANGAGAVMDITFPRKHRLLWAVGIDFAAKTQHRLIIEPFVFPTEDKVDQVICGTYVTDAAMAHWVYIGFQEGGTPFGFRTEKHAHAFAWPAEADRVSELAADLVTSIERHMAATRPARAYTFVDWRTYGEWGLFEQNVDDDLLALRQWVESVRAERRYTRVPRRRPRTTAVHGVLDRLFARYSPHLLD